MSSRLFLGAALLVATLGASTVDAQPATAPAAGPARGVDLSADVFGGWDANLGSAVIDPVTGETLPIIGDGGYAGLNARGLFRTDRRSYSIVANADASARGYADTRRDVVPGYSGGLQLRSADGRRVAWSASQTASYGPLNALAFFPGTAALGAPATDYQVANAQQFVGESSASLGYNLSRRSALTFAAAYNVLDAPTAEDSGLIHRYSATARYSRQVSRFASLYGGYGYSHGGSPANVLLTRSSTVHNIDLGFGYARPLSFSRHTTVSLQTGGTLVDDAGGKAQYQVIGSANVQHQVGRTWNFVGSYERAVRYVPTFVDPMLTSGFAGQASGQLTLRSAVRLLGNVSRGQVGLNAADNDVATYSMSAQYRYAVRQRLGLFAEYFYFQSAFDTGVQLSDGLVRDLKRSGVRVGLSMGTTLLGARR